MHGRKTIRSCRCHVAGTRGAQSQVPFALASSKLSSLRSLDSPDLLIEASSHGSTWCSLVVGGSDLLNGRALYTPCPGTLTGHFQPLDFRGALKASLVLQRMGALATCSGKGMARTSH